MCDAERGPFFEGLAAQHRTRKLFTTEDPSLHIFVVTLRCDHRCPYCQVTPRLVSERGFDMTRNTADAALDLVFESRAPCLTIEFQGGESALAFERIRYIVERAETRQRLPGQQVRFVMATTLHLLTDAMLAFCRDHKIELSTSLDGPAHVHNANRINRTRDSFERTVAACQGQVNAKLDNSIGLATYENLGLIEKKPVGVGLVVSDDLRLATTEVVTQNVKFTMAVGEALASRLT